MLLPGGRSFAGLPALEALEDEIQCELELIVADTNPDALDGTSDPLSKRRSGGHLRLPPLDDEMAGNLEALLGRLDERYRAAHGRED